MKTITKFGILLLAVMLIACQKDNSEPGASDDIISIVDGMILSPEWLVDEVNRVADQYSPSPETGEKFYPLVYSIRYNGRDYIFVWDGLNACWACGHRYFTLSGDLIDPESSLQFALEEVKRGTDDGLLWRYEYISEKSKSIATRADHSISFFTPYGTPVPDTWICDEWYNTSSRISYGRNYFKSAYPNAEEVSGPSTTYNCHGYVWSITEGGSPVWIGYNRPGETNVFVDDGSYVVTSSGTSGAKVRYLNTDHSAIAETPDIFVSKWNEFPLYRHHKTYSPFGSSPQLAYYKRVFNPVITGPSSPNPNTDVTYSVPTTLPTGIAFRNWTISPTSGYTVTGGTTGRSLTIRFTSRITFTVSANFGLPDGSTYTARRVISMAPAKPETPAIRGRGMEVQQIYLPGYTDPVFWARPGTSPEFVIDNLNSFASHITFEWLVPFYSGIYTGRSYRCNIPLGNGSGIHGIWCIAVDGSVESDMWTTWLYISSVSPMSLPVKEQKVLAEQLNAMPKSSKEEFERQRRLLKQ